MDLALDMLDKLPDKIKAKIYPDPKTGCWIWVVADSGNGYGHVWFNKQSWVVHRLVYTLLVGDIPIGLELDHTCLVTFCVRYDHLDPVNHQENMRRASLVRIKCGRGHLFTPDNTYIEPTMGWKICKKCKRISHDKTALRVKGYSGRIQTAECVNGHQYTPENTYVSPTEKIMCKICRRAAKERYNERRMISAKVTKV